MMKAIYEIAESLGKDFEVFELELETKVILRRIGTNRSPRE